MLNKKLDAVDTCVKEGGPVLVGDMLRDPGSDAHAARTPAHAGLRIRAVTTATSVIAKSFLLKDTDSNSKLWLHFLEDRRFTSRTNQSSKLRATKRNRDLDRHRDRRKRARETVSYTHN